MNGMYGEPSGIAALHFLHLIILLNSLRHSPKIIL